MCQEVCLFRLHRVCPSAGVSVVFQNDWSPFLLRDGGDTRHWRSLHRFMANRRLARALSLSVFFVSSVRAGATSCRALNKKLGKIVW